MRPRIVRRNLALNVITTTIVGRTNEKSQWILKICVPFTGNRRILWSHLDEGGLTLSIISVSPYEIFGRCRPFNGRTSHHRRLCIGLPSPRHLRLQCPFGDGLTQAGDAGRPMGQCFNEQAVSHG